MNNTKFESIQALRGLAALAVVLFHAWATFDVDDTNLPLWFNANFLKKGSAGVDLFFVISGFVIAWSALLGKPERETPTEFYVRRFFRVVPVYWFASIIYIYFFANATQDQTIGDLLFQPRDFRDAPYYGVPALYVGWSLVYELYFYLVFGACLIFRKHAITAALAYFALTLFALPTVMGIAFDLSPNHAHTTFRTPYAAMATNPIILEFLMGVGVAYLYKYGRKWFTGWQVAALLVVAVLAVLVGLQAVRGFSLLWRGLPFALLVFALLLAEDRRGLRVPQFLVYLGSISYSLYLVHPFVLKFLTKVRTVPDGQWHFQVIEYVIVVACSVWAADRMHRYIEVPCISAGKALLTWLRGLASASSMLAEHNKSKS